MLKRLGIKSRNIPIIFLTEVIGGMLFFLPVLALYFEESLFSVTNVAIIFAVESLCVVLFEIPTGAIADLFGRKKSIILAHVFVLAALAFLAIGGSMIMFIIFAILNAFARSLTSGTYSAFVYDTLKDEDKENHFKKVFGTLLAFWPLGASIGSVVGGYLATISLSLPVLATFFPITIAFFLTLFLKEPNYEKEEHKNVAKHMLNASKLVAGNTQLLILLLASFVMLALGGTIHLFSPIFFKFKEIPIVFFGYIFALTFGFSSLGHYLSHNISEKFGNKLTLIWISILSPLFILVATLTTGYILIAFYTISSIFFGIKNPIMDHLINKKVDSKKRATVLSVYNFTGNLGLAIAMPLIGYYAEIFTINTAVQLSAIFLLIVPIIFIFIKKDFKEG